MPRCRRLPSSCGSTAPRMSPVRSVMLDVQIQIAARRRPYDDAAKERLAELFGTARPLG